MRLVTGLVLAASGVGGYVALFQSALLALTLLRALRARSGRLCRRLEADRARRRARRPAAHRRCRCQGYL